MGREKNSGKYESLIRHGDAATWHEIPEENRQEVISYAVRCHLIDKPRAYLLDWILRSEILTVVDKNKVNELIAHMRGQLFDTLPAAPEEGPVHVEIPKSPKLPDLPLLPERNDYILDPYEVIERFRNLGINLERLMDQWAQFYQASGYAHHAREMNNGFVLPEMTNEAMEAFERGFRERMVDMLIIDDNRLDEGTTLKVFQPSTSRRSRKKYGATRQLSRPFLMDFLDGNIVDFECSFRKELLKDEKDVIKDGYTYQSEGQRAVRLVATKTGLNQPILPLKKENFAEAADLLADPYTTLMSLGTWTRLLHYIKNIDAASYHHFISSLAEPNKGGYRSFPEILLNSFTKDGHFVTATGHLNRKEFLTKASTTAHPFQLDRYTVPIVTIQSDCPPLEDEDDHIIDAEFSVNDEDDIPF